MNGLCIADVDKLDAVGDWVWVGVLYIVDVDKPGVLRYLDMGGCIVRS